MEIYILFIALVISSLCGIRGWAMYFESQRQADINNQQLHANISFLQSCLDRRSINS